LGLTNDDDEIQSIQLISIILDALSHLLLAFTLELKASKESL
jgi:hypothetical protein